MLDAVLRSGFSARSHGLACALGVAACGAPAAGVAPPSAPAAPSAQPSAAATAAPAAPGAAKGKAGPEDAKRDDDDRPPGVATVPVPIQGSALVHGKSTVIVNAPFERVREGVLGFGHYAEFMPHYSSCRVLGRTPTGGRDVYMEVEALHGAVHMWARVDFPKPSVVDGTETYQTKFLDGNVRDFAATWRLRKVDDAKTELSLEVFLHPKIPLPDGLVNEENLDGSASGVHAMRTRVERAPAIESASK